MPDWPVSGVALCGGISTGSGDFNFTEQETQELAILHQNRISSASLIKFSIRQRPRSSAVLIQYLNVRTNTKYRYHRTIQNCKLF